MEEDECTSDQNLLIDNENIRLEGNSSFKES